MNKIFDYLLKNNGEPFTFEGEIKNRKNDFRLRTNIKIIINENHDVRFEFESHFLNFGLNNDDIEVAFDEFDASAVFCFVTSSQISSDGTGQFVLTPRVQPVLIGSALGTKSLNGLLISGPELLLPVGGDGTESFERLVSLENNDISLNISRADREAMYSPRKVSKGMRPKSHKLTVQFKGPVQDQAQIDRNLSLVLDFLSFVRGSQVGISNYSGQDDASNPTILIFGATKSNAVGHENSWFEWPLTNELPSLFQSFCNFNKTKENRTFIHRSLSYFCLGNSLRSVALEPALVMSMTALEVICDYLLGTSTFEKLKKKPGGMANVFRGAFAKISLKEAPELGNDVLVQAINSNSWSDGFEALVKTRNCVTHSKASVVGRLPLHESVSASQWLVEMALLKILNYSGKYADRRISRWIGDHKDLPF